MRFIDQPSVRGLPVIISFNDRSGMISFSLVFPPFLSLSVHASIYIYIYIYVCVHFVCPEEGVGFYLRPRLQACWLRSLGFGCYPPSPLGCSFMTLKKLREERIWMVVKIMVPFGLLRILRHLVFRGPKKGTTILTTTHIEYVTLEILHTLGLGNVPNLPALWPGVLTQ